jgi:hypothetical protein
LQRFPDRLFLIGDGGASFPEPPASAVNPAVNHEPANNASPFSSEDDVISPVQHDNVIKDKSSNDRFVR